MFLSSISTRLLIHDCNSWCLKHNHGVYNENIRDISWSDDGKYMLQVNPKGLVEILSTTEAEVRSLQHVPLRETWTATFHREGHRNVAIGSKNNGQVLIWDTKFKNVSKTFPTPSQPATVDYLSFNAKNTHLAASMHNGDTIIYGVTTTSPPMTVKTNRSKSISAMKFHYESRSLLGLATEEGHVLLRDITSNKDKVFFKSVHASPVSDFTFSLINRDVLLSCGYDKIMHVYDIRLENVVSTIRTSYPLTSVAINVDNQVALGSRKGVILLYDLRDFSTPLTVIKDHTEEVRRVVFQPVKKKLLPNETSLKEDTPQLNFSVPPGMSSPVIRNKTELSPTITRTPDLFLNCDSSSPKSETNEKVKQTNEDSFLFMLGLDQSNAEVERPSDYRPDSSDRRIDLTDLKMRKFDSSLNDAKSSTPIITKLNDAPASQNRDINGVYQNGFSHNSKIMSPLTTTQPQVLQNLNGGSNAVTVREVTDELKSFLAMSMADLSEENRQSYLHIMMALTKQKLFLQKELQCLTQHVQNIEQSQNNLKEDYKRLAMEVEFLKANNRQDL